MFLVREIFATLQGEGSRTGSPAVFVRLAGCNLWSGVDSQRGEGTGHCAAWCDTDFRGGDRLTVAELYERISVAARAAGYVRPLIVFSGGEPMLQLGRSSMVAEVVTLLSWLGTWAEVALETNGTRPMPDELAPLFHHVTVSPKGMAATPGAVAHLASFHATDLKIVVPTPLPIQELKTIFPHEYLYFQPLDSGDRGQEAFAHAVREAGAHGGRVSIQTHKWLGLP